MWAQIKYLKRYVHLSTSGFQMTDPIICYILDGALLFYSVIATMLFFKIKVSCKTCRKKNKRNHNNTVRSQALPCLFDQCAVRLSPPLNHTLHSCYSALHV
uniref:T-cell surface glycoprotein CD3 zeta chain n=1 Tax=Esox lucius TaxID=8010 RepID=A0AAY5KIX6_ESOLU